MQKIYTLICLCCLNIYIFPSPMANALEQLDVTGNKNIKDFFEIGEIYAFSSTKHKMIFLIILSDSTSQNDDFQIVPTVHVYRDSINHRNLILMLDARTKNCPAMIQTVLASAYDSRIDPNDLSYVASTEKFIFVCASCRENRITTQRYDDFMCGSYYTLTASLFSGKKIKKKDYIPIINEDFFVPPFEIIKNYIVSKCPLKSNKNMRGPLFEKQKSILIKCSNRYSVFLHEDKNAAYIMINCDDKTFLYGEYTTNNYNSFEYSEEGGVCVKTSFSPFISDCFVWSNNDTYCTRFSVTKNMEQILKVSRMIMRKSCHILNTRTPRKQGDLSPADAKKHIE